MFRLKKVLINLPNLCNISVYTCIIVNFPLGMDEVSKGTIFSFVLENSLIIYSPFGWATWRHSVYLFIYLCGFRLLHLNWIWLKGCLLMCVHECSLSLFVSFLSLSSLPLNHTHTHSVLPHHPIQKIGGKQGDEQAVSSPWQDLLCPVGLCGRRSDHRWDSELPARCSQVMIC